MANKNIIYGLVDPITNEVRYVGQSSTGLKRPRSHVYAYNLVPETHKNHWIKSLIKKGLKPEIVILESEISEDLLDKAEIFWIKQYRELLGDVLTNAADGGCGNRGVRHGALTRQRMAMAKQGKLLSDQHKKAIGDALRGKPKNPASIAKRSLTRRGKPLSNEARIRLRLVNINYWTAERRAQWRLHHPNKVKTACKRGHSFDIANTYHTKDGKRVCRKCKADFMFRVRLKRKTGLAGVN